MSTPLFWLNTFLVILSLGHMLYQRRPAQSLIAWMLTLILIPFGGVLLYFIFGSRKVLYRKPKPLINFEPLRNINSTVATEGTLAEKLAKLIEGNHLTPPSANNQLQLYTDAEQAFSALLEAIDQAQKTIYFETYIFELDHIGKTLLERLAEKARQGVKVCLLIDAFGALPLYLQQWKLRPYRQAGVEIAFFHPFETLFKNRLNLRTHRKIYLFDEHQLFTGGINLSKDYLALPCAPLNHPSWIDLCFQIQGDDCLPYTTVFKEDWQYTTGQTLPKNPPKKVNFPSPAQGFSPILLQTVPSGPDIESDPLLEALLQAIISAEKSITLVTPYLIPSHNLLDALHIALKKGVQVTLLTPQKTDHLIFDWGRSSYMRELHEMGAQIFCYAHNMIHAKLLIFDDDVCMLGSANLDYRSLLVNYEMVSFSYDAHLAQTMQHWVKDLIQRAQPYQPNPSKFVQSLENGFRIFTPLL